jgi:cytochrome oxidase Cu insertion factor (SCO1/SenC/PrrC family)
MRSSIAAMLLAAGLVLAAQGAPCAEDSKAAAKPEPPPPPPEIAIGDTAPDFTLHDQAMNEVSLRSFRGKKNVVLAFYVFAFTGG